MRTSRRKRVIGLVMAVSVIVLVIIVLAFLPPEDPPETQAEAKARLLIAELRLDPPGRIRQWLIDLDLIERPPMRNTRDIMEDLVRLGPPAVPALISGLSDSSPPPHSGDCLSSLSEISRMYDHGPWSPPVPEPPPDFVARLKGAKSFIRFASAETLSKMGRTDLAVPFLLRNLESKDPAERSAAAGLLGCISPPAKEAVPKLIEAMKDENLSVRSNAVDALGRIGPAAIAAVPALIEALRHPAPLVRNDAATVLGKIGTHAKAAVPALTEALNDKYEPVRLEAGKALVRLGLPGRGLPVLIAALEHESPHFRHWAASTLGNLGAPAKPAIPALTKALNDGEEDVREAAAAALKKIQAARATREAGTSYPGGNQ